MAEPVQEDALDEAIRWRIRLRDGDDADWAAFTRWLDGSPKRSLAYDRVAAVDKLVEHEISVDRAFKAVCRDTANRPSDMARRTPFRWPVAAAFTAATISLGLIAFIWPAAESTRYEVATRVGEQRKIVVGNGDAIDLNGGTRLILDRRNPRLAELAVGEATFTVGHDAARPFTVTVGDHQLRDAGTVFNVVRDNVGLSVKTIEGSVIVDPATTRIALSAGEALTITQGGRHRLSRSDPGTMAGWRRGQLSYQGERLDLVASDLSRSLGVNVRIAPSYAARSFTGSLRVGNDHARTVGEFAAMLGLHAHRKDGGWLIDANASS
ncbi:FecR domain-containing protein [Sphingomonas sp. SUN019]|uniref:FecR family protein n=1 Tax=Sphingomonas sp. SUN019 TaxID=2937788 RepID=UPI002164AB2C|nr:FecR domain-containing protein [Sphingomonas sp. SUN019]UVO49683.1 FecR domain-containing protein [Sphingomonas sp. SUN019]